MHVLQAVAVSWPLQGVSLHNNMYTQLIWPFIPDSTKYKSCLPMIDSNPEGLMQFNSFTAIYWTDHFCVTIQLVLFHVVTVCCSSSLHPLSTP